MKYFITGEERKKSGSTCFIEFQRGEYDNEIWHISSICIDEELFYDLKLRKLFSSVLPQFDYFGITQVLPEHFARVKDAASTYLPETAECINELDSWLKQENEDGVMFTIVGM